MKKYCVGLLALFLSLFSHVAYPILDIELTQGVDSAIPIAVMPFMGQELISAEDKNVPQVVSRDLQNSGRFRLASVSNLLPNLSKDAVNYDYWRQQKVDDVVAGQVKNLGGGRYQVSFQLIGIFNRVVLLDRQYTVTETQLRVLAHHISDLIYQQLTGDPGIFSTKIAYILVQRDPVTHRARYSFEVSDFDGYNPRTLLVSDQPLMSPAWSQDGKKIAYVSFEGNRAAIYAQDVATGQRQLISKQPGINGAPAWSPDGSKMALVLSSTGSPKIYVLDLGSNSLNQITGDWYLDTEPSWSPDGKSLLFTSNRSGGPQIYRVYLDSKRVERVTYHGNYNARASFTSDGKGIAVLHQDGSMFNVAYQDLDTGKLITLTRSGFDESPSIAPNGKMVAYATNYNNRGILAVVSVDGRVKLLLPAREGEVQEPAWSPFLNTQKT